MISKHIQSWRENRELWEQDNASQMNSFSKLWIIILQVWVWNFPWIAKNEILVCISNSRASFFEIHVHTTYIHCYGLNTADLLLDMSTMDYPIWTAWNLQLPGRFPLDEIYVWCGASTIVRSSGQHIIMHHGVIYDMIQGEEWNVAIARGTKGGYGDMMISASLTDCVCWK